MSTERSAACSIAALMVFGVFLLLSSCKPSADELLSWSLPTDLPEHQTHLKFLYLPSGVKRLDWLAPNLEHLVARGATAEGLAGLPEGLISLDVAYSQVRQIGALPPSLRRLDLRFSDVTDLHGLPVGIQWLALGGPRIKSLAGVSSSVRELVLEEAPALRGLENLPRSLEALTLIGASFNDMIGARFNDLGGLPPSLRNLELDGTRITGSPPSRTLCIVLCSETTASSVAALYYLGF